MVCVTTSDQIRVVQNVRRGDTLVVVGPRRNSEVGIKVRGERSDGWENTKIELNRNHVKKVLTGAQAQAQTKLN